MEQRKEILEKEEKRKVTRKLADTSQEEQATTQMQRSADPIVPPAVQQTIAEQSSDRTVPLQEMAPKKKIAKRKTIRKSDKSPEGKVAVPTKVSEPDLKSNKEATPFKTIYGKAVRSEEFIVINTFLPGVTPLTPPIFFGINHALWDEEGWSGLEKETRFHLRYRASKQWYLVHGRPTLRRSTVRNKSSPNPIEELDSHDGKHYFKLDKSEKPSVTLSTAVSGILSSGSYFSGSFNKSYNLIHEMIIWVANRVGSR